MANLKHDLVGIGLSCVVGAAVFFTYWALSGFTDPHEHPLYFEGGYIALAVSALVLGALFRNRVWRWAPCMIGTKLALEFSIHEGDLNQLPIGLIWQAIVILILIMISYLGMWTAKMWLRGRQPPMRNRRE
jgi:hypothetical protein